MLLASAYSVERNVKLFMAPGSDFDKKKIGWKLLFDLDEQVQFMEMDDEYMYLWTCKDAPNYKYLQVPLKDFDMSKATVFIPENEEWLLDGSYLTKSGMLYTLSRRSLETTLWFKPWGKPARQLELPFPASTVSLNSWPYSYRKNEAIVFLGGWTSPMQRYRYLVDEDRFELAMISPPIEYLEYDDLTVEELMVPSYDGVEVPLSLIYKKGLKKDDSAPLLMRGYGSYGSSSYPRFNDNELLWTLEGGIVAIAHVRGGGELGNDWYLAGKKTTKPNTWKDLIACAEYLHREGYSSPAKTAIMGASAGGILIGRAMTERPDLFAVAIPKVGCLNPLRQEHSPNGPVNVPEFGSSKIEEECRALIEMDAYLHLKDGVKYPATLVTAGFNDPRVIAWQPAKFAARLQVANASDRPILLRVDYEGGHFTSDTKTQLYEDWADVMGFALWQMGVAGFQPKNKP
jgi:prolyl oligopeptidase